MRHKNMASNNHNSPGLNFSAIYTGTLITLITAIPLGLIAGVIYYLSSLPESTMPFVVMGILILSVFGGGFFAACKAGVKGLYHGFSVAILCFVVIWLISALFIPTNITLAGFTTKLVVLLVGGSLGGILGITLSH